MQAIGLGRCERWDDWAGLKDVSRGILVIPTPRQGQKKGLQLEAILVEAMLVEAMLVLPQAITTGHILPPECQQPESPSTGHSTSSTALFPISLCE